MANLSLARQFLDATGVPLWTAGARQLLEPFQSPHALLDAVEPAPDVATPAGLPAWMFLLRTSALLLPPATPRWKTAISDAAMRASRLDATQVVTLGSAQLQARHAVTCAVFCARWCRALQQPEPPFPSLAALLEAAIAERDTAFLCAVLAVDGMGELGARAKGALADVMETADSVDTCLILEAAIHSGQGPRDKVNRRARELLGKQQDPVTGGWPGAAAVTFQALLLLMRGG